MHIKSSLLAVCIFTIFSLAETTNGQVYSDNFSSSSLDDRANAYLGGFYGSNIGFDQWFGSSVEAAISGGELIVDSTSGLRGAFLVLDPAVFGSDTDFSLHLDVTSLSLGAGGNSATARVFTGTGYDLSLNSSSALFINPQTGGITPLGGASVVLAAESSLVLGAGQTVDFTRPDGHAVMIFLGVNGGAWPFPEMKVGEMSIHAVPEPSSVLLLGLGSLTLLRRKRPSHV